MLRVVYSNRTEELIRELAARVRAQQAPGGLGALVPVPLVVPGAAIESAVRLGIAREAGIAANLDVQLLTRFAANVVGARVADAAAIEAMVLELLLGDLGDEALAPLRAYLSGASAAGPSARDDREAVDGRRAQLAARIGRIFEEYTYSRGEMLAAWLRSDEPQLGPRYAETEAWQRRLWRLLFAPEGAASRRTPRVVALHEAVAAFEPRRDAPPVHVFGFAHVARGFHALLEKLGRAADVIVYTLSPCEGFWEDVNERDAAPLHLWSRPGRDHVRALNAAAGFDHDDRFVDPLDAPGGERARTLLRQIQSDVMRREPARAQPDPRFAFDGDRSLEVHGHASIRRECEAVAADVWRRVRADASLHFDDVAVLVPSPDAATYVAHMTAAMREAHDLPHQVVGAGGGAPGRTLEAIELLLALPLGRFTRPELLRLLVHPAVVAAAARAGGGALDPERWVAWCDALGIVHGADRDDHAATYIERDILNWDQGLRRLALGAFMAGDASGAGEPVRAPGGESYVPLEVAGTELPDAATFGLLVRSLVADARFARDASLTPREWAALLRAMVETYVAPASDAEGDELSRRLRQLGSLADVDLGGARVSYRIARELVSARLVGAAAGGASRSGDGGVVVSTLAQTRGIPYRVVYACGMGEGRFPSPDAEDPLDLRWARRSDDSARSKRAESNTRPGDVTARDRDKYAFLEMLLGARDALVLSYVSRDPLTGDALAPSSVVQELLHAVSQGYRPARGEGAEGGAPGVRVVHPLRRWDDAVTAAEIPEAQAEARTVAVRRSAERHAAGAPLPTRGEVLARADAGDPAWRALAEHLGLARLPETLASIDGRVRVPMYAIVKFLEMPLQGWASFRLGLDETESEDLAARDSEPFETAPRDETLILRDVMLAAAQTGCSLEQAYDAAVRDRELRGLGPSGVFARGERADALRALETWKQELERRGVRPESMVVHRFGRAGEHSRPARAHEPVVIDVDVPDASGKVHVVRAEIQGRTLPVGASEDAAVSVTLAKRANEATDPWARAGRQRSLLRSFVDHAVLSAAGEEPASPEGLVVVASQEGPVGEHARFRALGPDAAKGWLRGVVRELLGAPHAYFLPCEAVFVRQGREDEPPAVAVIEEARDKLRGGDGPPALRSAYGPVPRPQEYPAPDEATAREMIARRFGPVLERDERRKHEEGEP